MGKYDTGAIGNTLEAFLRGFMEIELEVKPTDFVIMSLNFVQEILIVR